MNEYLPIVLLGITSGSIIAVAALGLVLSYKASGIFNFAQGAVSALSAGVFYQLHVVNGLPWPVAAILTLLLVGVGFGLIMERVAQYLAPVSTTMKVVATVGIMISLTSLFSLRYGDVVKTYPAFLPPGTFRVLGAYVSYAQLITVIIGLACAVGLTVFFRRTALGRSMRAVVDDGALVSLTGHNPNAVRRAAWVMGCSFAAIAGMLIAPDLGLDGPNLTLLVVTSFGAAAVGRFTNLPLTYLGAVLIEVLSSLVSKWTGNISSLQSLATTIPFIVLFVVLLVTPKRKLVEVGAMLQERLPRPPHPPRAVGAVKLAVPVIILAFVPYFVGTHLLAWTQGLVYAILMLSLGLLVRTANQISLCQMTFAAIGGVVFYRLSQAGVPWLVCLFVAALAAVPVGLVISVPAIRLSGVYLGLATLGFGFVVESVAFPTTLMFGNSVVPVASPRPSWAMGDQSYYYLALIALFLSYLVVRVIEGARLGRFLHAKADAPAALQSLGVNNAALPVVAFCVAAGMAGFAGALIGPIFQVVGVGNFQTFPTGLLLVALFVLGSRNPKIGSFGAAIGAAIGLVVIPDYIQSSTVLNCLNLFFGLAALEAAAASTGESFFVRIRRWTARRRSISRIGLAGTAWTDPGPSADLDAHPNSVEAGR